MKYNKEALQFIKSAIKQREKLIRLKASKKNTMQMLNIIDDLNINISCLNLTSDLAAAKFFNRFSDKVRLLITDKRLPQFILLFTMSQTIISNAETINTNTFINQTSLRSLFRLSNQA